MPSIIEGYIYDIFISYRQKDNRGERWVSEFVESLKTELESTFKEEISVYFDINPHDGLLETHDVDESLKEKLKCLIFIPIISRTYCDTKSFAWEHEFKAFVEKASHDQFGLKVKLPNGNITSRVLPIRIHDLNNEDIKLCETVTGGFLRGVEFIYKEPGVNRPLRSNEDNPHDNLNHTIYRNQINKVALTARDILEGIKTHLQPSQLRQKEGQTNKIDEEKPSAQVTRESEKIKSRKEKLHYGYKPGRELKFVVFLNRIHVIVPSTLLIAAILGFSIYLVNRRIKIKWAKEKTLTEISRLVDQDMYVAAFNLAKEAQKYIPKDPQLIKLWPRFSSYVTTSSNPSGANIYRRDYNSKDTNWIYIGETPLDSVNVPYGFYKIKITKSGYETVYDASSSMQLSQRNYLLDSIGSIPENMVHIPEIRIMISLPSLTPDESLVISDYLIDKYEVTNKEYKEFVDAGGYRSIVYWKQPFYRSSIRLSWEEAMTGFVDKTDIPGPSTWEAGIYPKGEEGYPVSGISWFEAAAYAEFKGKSLPTYYHWRRAAGLDYRSYLPRMTAGIDRDWGISFIILNSNLNATKSAPVGGFPGLAGFGTYDIVGNVREWCWNETKPGGKRFIMGGGWNDASYLSNTDFSQDPFNRSATNGFRCVSLLHSDDFNEILESPIEEPAIRDFMNEKPASDQQFEIFKRMFAYEKTDLNPEIISIDSSESLWIKQKISFNAAYGNERVTAYLFLPRNFKGPYQTVVYFPGASAAYMLSSESLVMNNLDFLIQGGRAVLYPIYKGTYERQFELSTGNESKIARREHTIQWYQDFARSIDYIFTRSDIDTNKIAYFGFSWGGRLGALMTVLDDRIKVSILYVAGLNSDRPFPEIDDFNYVHRVSIPTLMLNGKYDADFPYETSQKPFFELLGTSPENKRHYLYESGHFVPRTELMKESLHWLDQYLGPVQ